MNKHILRADLLLLLTAAVWGFGFVAQRSGMRYVGPFTYNGIRFLLGSLSLLPVYFLLRKSRPGAGAAKPDSLETAGVSFLTGAFLAGTCLFIAVSLQQLGMMVTTAGNAGFITGLYVIFVPIFGIFLGRKTGKATWIGALLMLTGLYFLSTASASLTAGTRGALFGGINPGDLIILVSAVFWAFHVLLIDRLVLTLDSLAISVGQFAFAGLYSFAAAFLLEPVLSAWLETTGREFLAAGLFEWKSFPVLISGLRSGAIPFSRVSSAIVPLLYGGLFSTAVGYTLQVVAQKDAPPAHATIILCLEGTFGALGGILILGESAGKRTLVGFVLALAGMIISQWDLIRGRAGKP